jgi:hypothetical protein
MASKSFVSGQKNQWNSDSPIQILMGDVEVGILGRLAKENGLSLFRFRPPYHQWQAHEITANLQCLGLS